MRLIDADAITNSNELATKIFSLNLTPYIKVDDLLDFIDKLPTIEATPVVHSRWELVAWHKGIKVCKCLNCNKTNLGNTPLCGHCGADMRNGGVE